MTTRIYLNASELSTAVALNPYEKTVDILLKYWQRYFPDDFEQATSEAQISVNRETEAQLVNRMVGNNDELKRQVQQTMTSNCHENLQQMQQQILQNNRFDGMKQEDKEKLTRALTSMTNKSFGTRKETDAIALFEGQHEKRVIRVGKYFKQYVYETLETDIEWWIAGKVDGLTEENELVEVKNRVKAFFNTLRPYEKVQVHLYMKLLDVQTGYLVEALMHANTQTINVVPIEWDFNFWQDLYIRIVNFATLFNHFMVHQQAKECFLRSMASEKDLLDLEKRIRSYVVTGQDLTKVF